MDPIRTVALLQAENQAVQMNAELVVAAQKVFFGMPHPEWHTFARCKKYPDVNFFPERGEDTEPAKAICGECPVREQCEAFGVEGDEVGIWGGTTGRQRRTLRKTTAAARSADESAA